MFAMKSILLTGILTLTVCFTQSYGQSTINEPYDVERLMDRFIEHNAEAEIKGWRIMISLTRDRRKIEIAKSRFERYFPEYRCNMSFNDPYYKLIACAFRDKLEAAVVLNKIRRHFPGATETVDGVSHEEIFETMMAGKE